MAPDAVIEKKMTEVNEIAARLGVDRYIGTDRMSPIEAIVAEWAVQSEGTDFMAQESLWLDAKSEIESVLADMSLTHNTKHELFLLGAAQSGAMPLDEVRGSLVDGWNRLLSIHATAIKGMSQHDLKTIDRARDSALSKIPVFGTVEDKHAAIETAREALLALEQTLVASSKKAEQAEMKGEIANRMTTKGMILAEARSAKKQSLIPYGDYQEIMSLVGEGGVFSDQVRSIGNFSHDPSIILDQMDRVLDRAMSILNRESSATTLAGGMFVSSERQHRISQLGSTNNAGDGIRMSGNENANYRGTTAFTAGPSIAIAPFDPRADPNAHKVTEEIHTSLRHKAAGKLQAKHDEANQGLYKTGMGGNWANKNPGYATAGSVAGFAVLIWGITRLYASRQSKPKNRQRYLNSGFGTW